MPSLLKGLKERITFIDRKNSSDFDICPNSQGLFVQQMVIHIMQLK